MKKRKEATPEQKEAAALRREQIKGLMAQVKAITPEQRVLIASTYGIRNTEGRELSPYNQCLLIMQNPKVSVVGGFAQWKTLDRHVLKGSRALAIWVPISGKGGEVNSPDCTALVPHGSEPGDDAGGRSNFILGNVFDITQTETASEREARLEAMALESGNLELSEVASSPELALVLA